MNLTKGRKEPCKNNAGGIRKLYLTSYVDHDTRAIIGYRDSLLTSFPSTQIFEFEGVEKVFTEAYNEEGFYTQEVRIKFIKQDHETTGLIAQILKNKVRAITIDWNGEIKIAGLMNGLDVGVTGSLGSTKGEFNGYEVTMYGEELFSAPFADSLEGVGFIQGSPERGCLLSSSGRPSSLGDLVSSCDILISQSA